MNRVLARVPLLFVAACPAALTLRAQSGVVRSGGEMIPGAVVTASQGAAKITTTTNRDGHYLLPPLLPGPWTIEADMFGFAPQRKPVQDPGASQHIDFDLTLIEAQPAGNRAGRQVSGDDELEAQLAGASGEQTRQSTQNPSAGGNETFLLSGSLTQGAPPATQTGAGGSMRFGGGTGMPDATGGQASPVPGFTAGSGGRGGSFGGPRGGDRFGGRGARQFNGTQAGNRRPPNEIHGMIFGTLGNSALDAKPYSISGQNVSQPAFAQARFGVVLGGPLMIPKIVHDSSTFFFLSFFATRATNPYTATSTVPTLQERVGSFSQAAQPIYDPITGIPFPGNMIPGARVNPIAEGLLSYIPLPTQPGLVNNFVFQSAVPQNTANFSLRLQRNVSKKDRLALQFNFQNRDGSSAQPFGFLDSTSGSGWTGSLSWTHNFSANLISTARVSFNRNTNQTLPFFAYGSNVAAELGIAGTPGSAIDYGPPNLNFTNFGALTDATPVLTRNQSQSASESVMWVRGAHTFTLGGQFSRNDLNSTQRPERARHLQLHRASPPARSTARRLPVPGPDSTSPIFCWGCRNPVPSATATPAPTFGTTPGADSFRTIGKRAQPDAELRPAL